MLSTCAPLKYQETKVSRGIQCYSLSRIQLCHHMDCSPPGSSVHRILQAGILEWVAISFSMESSWPRDLNPGLLNCRQILYHLSHQGNVFRGMVNTTYSFIHLFPCSSLSFFYSWKWALFQTCNAFYTVFDAGRQTEEASGYAQCTPLDEGSPVTVVWSFTSLSVLDLDFLSTSTAVFSPST